MFQPISLAPVSCRRRPALPVLRAGLALGERGGERRDGARGARQARGDAGPAKPGGEPFCQNLPAGRGCAAQRRGGLVCFGKTVQLRLLRTLKGNVFPAVGAVAL